MREHTELVCIIQNRVENGIVYFLLCFGVHTPTQYALSCKIQKVYFYANRKKSKLYLGAPKLKENGSEYSLLEIIYDAHFYSVL